MHATPHGTGPRLQACPIARLICTLACLPCALQPASGQEPWRFEITPYFWAAGVSADVDVGRFGTQDVDVGFSDIWSELDFAAMLAFEARRGRWGALADAQYLKISTRQPSTNGLLGDVDTEFDQQILTLAALYRMADRSLVIDLLGGARYVRAKTRVDAGAGTVFSGRVVSDTDDWADALIGTRMQWPLGERWSLMAYVDVGAGSSDITWQAIAGANFRLTPAATLKLGYRTLRYERDDTRLPKFSFDGIYLGAGFSF